GGRCCRGSRPGPRRSRGWDCGASTGRASSRERPVAGSGPGLPCPPTRRAGTSRAPGNGTWVWRAGHRHDPRRRRARGCRPRAGRNGKVEARVASSLLLRVTLEVGGGPCRRPIRPAAAGNEGPTITGQGGHGVNLVVANLELRLGCTVVPLGILDP